MNMVVLIKVFWLCGDWVILVYGGGGKVMWDLIEEVFIDVFRLVSDEDQVCLLVDVL